MHCRQGLSSSAVRYTLTTSGTVSQSFTRITARPPQIRLGTAAWQVQLPLAPLGIRVVMHKKPSQRGSWAPHGVDGFYLGLALQHYRCYRGWVVKTQRERVVDTVAWHPQAIVMPGASEKELLTKALIDLRTAIHISTSQLPQPYSIAHGSASRTCKHVSHTAS